MLAELVPPQPGARNFGEREEEKGSAIRQFVHRVKGEKGREWGLSVLTSDGLNTPRNPAQEKRWALRNIRRGPR